MNILVLNCGSSSIKYQLFNIEDQRLMAKGIVEKVGLKGSFLRHEKENGEKVKLEGEVIDHQTGIEYVLGVLISKEHGCLSKVSDINAVGHRMVHGGERFQESCLITEETIRDFKACIPLAPLHNPANLKGVMAMEHLLPEVPQVAVFDTAFHQTMPKHAYMYAIPYSLYKKYGIRRYGFHGTSHYYVARRACEILETPAEKLKIITCHLGNGSSMAAIMNGKSVDTTMGLTPVEGLIMGTRSGDMDLGVLTFVMEKEELNISVANTLVNKHSGMLGITGVSSDMREIEKAAEEGNERAILGLKMFRYRIKKYIGAYAAAMGGLDLLIFTGGIGENDPVTRELCCEGLEYMGLEFDTEKNAGLRGKEMLLSKPGSRVKVMTIPTNEELVIAEHTQRIVSGEW
ncbi:MAG TPA: acetate kinase [Bacteroidales bacterium]|nr:acetate kinase [Bacteroidales bacterium]